METTITATDKDKVLGLLIERSRSKRNVYIMPEDWENFLGYNHYEAIIDQFERLSLIQKLSVSKHRMYLYVNVEADGFVNRGGFEKQEMLFRRSIEDLLKEIEIVKPSLGEKFERFTTIANNLTSFLSAINTGIAQF